ncbi:MAG: tyrosine-type recombinase/integrase [Limisphaerales bacterium]
MQYWKPKLRKQRWGSRAAGTYQELASFYVRISHRGRKHAFTFKTNNENHAATKARDAYLDILSKGWDAVLAAKRPAPVDKKVAATVGVLLERVAESGLIKPVTMRNYSNCLRTVVSELFDLKGGTAKFDYVHGGNNEWREKVDAVPLSKITKACLNAWKQRRKAAAGTSPLKQDSANRTINSYIRCSRSLFADRIREDVKIDWPEPLPFSDVELEDAGSMAYDSKIDPDTLMAAASRELREAHRELYKIFLLGLTAGLRRGEIDGLEWPAFKWNQAVVRIENTDTTSVKTRASVGNVPLDAEVMAEFRKYHALRTSEYVIESTANPKRLPGRRVYRCDSLFKELNDWLRAQGITTNKPLHTLRKELGAMVTTQHGIYAAKDMLRHSDISTTARHYADQKNRVSVGLGKMLRTESATKRRTSA